MLTLSHTSVQYGFVLNSSAHNDDFAKKTKTFFFIFSLGERLFFFKFFFCDYLPSHDLSSHPCLKKHWVDLGVSLNEAGPQINSRQTLVGIGNTWYCSSVRNKWFYSCFQNE